jgi:hypothetical protein
LPSNTAKKVSYARQRKLILLHIVNIALAVGGFLVGGAMVVCWNYVKKGGL